MNNNTVNSTTIASALSIYIQAVTNLNGSSNANKTLSPSRIDNILSQLNATNIALSSSASFLMAQGINQNASVIASGASFSSSSLGTIVYNNNTNSVGNSNILAAAIVSNDSLSGLTALNMFIIAQPVTYRNITNSSNQTLASSVISVSPWPISLANSIKISLYFTVLPGYQPNVSATYYCSYYDNNTLNWNNYGCTAPTYNPTYQRYECNCNHTTTFGLTWVPSGSNQTTTSSYCMNSTHAILLNGSCVTNAAAQVSLLGIYILFFKCFVSLQDSAYEVLNSNNTNSTVVASALSLYIEATTNQNGSSNSNTTLSPNRIDNIVSQLNATNIALSTDTSFLMAQEVNQSGNVIVLGASFSSNSGGKIVYSNNTNSVINSSISAAAIISNNSLSGLTALNMLIIDQPTTYRNISSSTNHTLVSSVIVVSPRRNDSSSKIDISLYFKVVSGYDTQDSSEYLCSYYDNNTLNWNNYGCTAPTYNPTYHRYECNCNHTTSFGLIWLPAAALASSGQSLRAVDIASLVFQSISIVCFIIIYYPCHCYTNGKSNNAITTK